MPLFELEFDRTCRYIVEIEAESEEEAIALAENESPSIADEWPIVSVTWLDSPEFVGTLCEGEIGEENSDAATASAKEGKS